MLLIGATGSPRLRSRRLRAERRLADRRPRGNGRVRRDAHAVDLSLLRSIFTDRDQRRIAIAVWASMFSAGAARPIVGGILLEHFAWGSVFLMSVPVLVPLLVFAPLLVPESRDPRPGRIDPISSPCRWLTMVPIVYAIKEVAVHGFGLLPVLVSAASASASLFVRRQLAWSSRCSTCGCSPAAPSAARCW
jgi:hypothetical protein